MSDEKLRNFAELFFAERNFGLFCFLFSSWIITFFFFIGSGVLNFELKAQVVIFSVEEFIKDKGLIFLDDSILAFDESGEEFEILGC